MQNTSLEENIKDVINEKLNDGTVEKIVAEKLEQGISSAVESLFMRYGGCGEAISQKLEEVAVTSIESHDFSTYCVKLDTILTEIVNNTQLIDNKKILKNFKELMIEEKFKTIKLSEIFEKYCKCVSKEIDTDGLEICHDEGVNYSDANCTIEFIKKEQGYSIYEKGTLRFECEEDEKMNKDIQIRKYKNENWALEYEGCQLIDSLRWLNEFEIFIMKISRMGCKIEIDESYIEESVEIEAEPEADWR